VGTFGRAGSKRRLPIYMWPVPAVQAGRTGNFPLGPGESKRILYDWDDINFSEIVVAAEDGRQVQIVVDATPTKRQYHRPEKSQFVIPALDELERAEGPVLAAAERQHGVWTFRAVMVIGVVLPLLLWGLVRAYRREKRTRA